MKKELEIQEIKNHFKSRKEVEHFFGEDVFKFTFMSEGTIHFETLNPMYINGELHRFCISFYYTNDNDFFCYSSFIDWLDKYQLQEVSVISDETNIKTQMYFDRFNDVN